MPIKAVSHIQLIDHFSLISGETKFELGWGVDEMNRFAHLVIDFD